MMEQVVIIGGTSGIGHALSELHQHRGDHVTIVGRSVPDRPSGLNTVTADLSLLSGQDRAAADLRGTRIDRLIFTAGTLTARARTTTEGHDARYILHHIARQRLLEALSPQLSAGARVAFISSWGSYKSPPPAGYVYDAPRRGGLRHALNTYVPNDRLFAEFASSRADVSVLGYNPGPTRGTRLADRPDTPMMLRLIAPIFRRIARDVEIVAQEFAAATDTAPPGITWQKAGQRLARPGHLGPLSSKVIEMTVKGELQ